MTSLLGKALALAPTRTPVPFIGRAGSVLQSFMHKEDPEALMRAYGQVGTLFAIVEALFTYALIPQPEPKLTEQYLATLKSEQERSSATRLIQEYAQPRVLTFRTKSL